MRGIGVFAIGVLAATTVGCGSPSAPSRPTPAPASLAIAGLTAAAEPLTTTPAPGLRYVLTYQVRESAGATGATLQTQHIALSDGTIGNSDFGAALTTPHVPAGGAITVQSTLSVYPASIAAAHVTFSITYMDDMGRAGSAGAEADVVPPRP